MVATRPARGMTPGTAELYDRVVRLFATRDVSSADRQAIRAEIDPAIRFNSGITLTFADLSGDVRRLIEANEAKPQVNGWTSPKDVPPRDIPPATPIPGSRYLPTEQAAPQGREVAAAADDYEPTAEDWADLAANYDPDGPVRAAAGKDVIPGRERLHHWWVFGPGRARWNTFTELLANLAAEVHDKPLETLKTWAAAWFHERYGFWPGDDRNRVRQGKPPRGERIGPG
jgi:hypothetical protein